MARREQWLAGRLALVTGASKENGIGAAAAFALASHGANILIHYGKDATAANETVKLIESLGVRALAIAADQQSLTFGEDLVTAALKAFNTDTLDIIINNAGTANVYSDLESTPGADFDRIFQINVRGPFLLMQAALPHIPSSGGRIINVGSCVAKMGSPTANFYAGTKAALCTMGLGWAEQLGPKGITVNTVSPGPIDTDMAIPETHPMMSKFRANQNIKRNGTAAEVGEVIAFLCSPRASYITGQNLAVDGGIIKN